MSDTTGIYENVYYKKLPDIEKQQPATNLVKKTQEQVDELVEILHENVDKALEREHKISDLNAISDNLEKRASEFKTQSNVVKKKTRRVQKTQKKKFGFCQHLCNFIKNYNTFTGVYI